MMGFPPPYPPPPPPSPYRLPGRLYSGTSPAILRRRRHRKVMELITLAIVLLVIVFVFWFLISFGLQQLPAGAPRMWGGIFVALLALVVAIGLLQRFGLIPNLGSVKV